MKEKDQCKRVWETHAVRMSCGSKLGLYITNMEVCFFIFCGPSNSNKLSL